MAVTERKLNKEIENIDMQQLSLSLNAEEDVKFLHDKIKPLFPDLALKFRHYTRLIDMPMDLQNQIQTRFSEIIILESELQAALTKTTLDLSDDQKKYLNSDRIKIKIMKGELTIENAIKETSEEEIEAARKVNYNLLITGSDTSWSTYGVSPKFLIGCHNLEPNYFWGLAIPILAKDISPKIIMTMNSAEKEGIIKYNLSLEQIKACKHPFSHYHINLLNKGYSYNEIQHLDYPQMDLLNNGLPKEFVEKMTIKHKVISSGVGQYRNFYYNCTGTFYPHILIGALSEAENVSLENRQKLLNDFIKICKSLPIINNEHVKALSKGIALEIILDPRFKYGHVDLLLKNHPWEIIANLHVSQLAALNDELTYEGITLDDVDNDWWTPKHSLAIRVGIVTYQEIKGMDAKQLDEYLSTPSRTLAKKGVPGSKVLLMSKDARKAVSNIDGGVSLEASLQKNEETSVLDYSTDSKNVTSPNLASV